MNENKSSLLFVMQSVIVHRRLIFINILIVTILAVIISLILPKWYRATVVLLPPEKSESLSDLALSMGLKSIAMGGGGFALPVMASPSDLLASIAKSRAVAGRVVDTLNLVEYFKVDKKELAIRQLAGQVTVNVKAEGIIAISFISKDQDIVASVANSFARELDNINRLHKTQRAKELKGFIEEELAKNKINLNRAEDALRDFQKKNKAISLDNQVAASIQAAADLYSQLTLDQISLKVMEKSHAVNHPDVINLKYKISEIERKLTQIQDGITDPADSLIAFLAIPLADLPEISLQYFQLVRDLKKEETLHEVLVSQYEQAKISEAKDTPTISILDEAVTPLYKFKPKRAYIVITGFFLSFVFSIIYAIVIDRWREFRVTDPEKSQDISRLLSVLRSDLFGLKNKKIN
jgi:uncharacterized protein involved in exopolysaccharide biosynthesis